MTCICNDDPSLNDCAITNELISLDVIDEDTSLSILVYELIILSATKIKEDEELYIFYDSDTIKLITREYLSYLFK